MWKHFLLMCVHAWPNDLQILNELLHLFTLIFCELIEGIDIVYQLYYRIGHK